MICFSVNALLPLRSLACNDTINIVNLVNRCVAPDALIQRLPRSVPGIQRHTGVDFINQVLDAILALVDSDIGKPMNAVAQVTKGDFFTGLIIILDLLEVQGRHDRMARL